MIQINDKTIENVVNFPKNQNLEGDLILTLHSELTQKTYTFNVVDEGSSKRYYKFTLDFEEVDNGEYDYSINDAETGLIRIGLVEHSTPSVVAYTDEVNIIQYREDNSSDYRLQTKEVTYTVNGQNTVTADPEYYGLKKVIVNVDVPSQEINNQNKTIDISTNGYTSVTFDSGYTGLGTVGINVNVPTSGGEIEYATHTVNFDERDENLINKAASTLTNVTTGEVMKKVYDGNNIVFNNILPGTNYNTVFDSVEDYLLISGNSFYMSSWGGNMSENSPYFKEPSTSGYTDKYLTFQALTSGNFTFNKWAYEEGFTIEYKLNDGEWTTEELRPGIPLQIQLNGGDILMLKGNNEQYGAEVGLNCWINCDAQFKLYGNIMSLVYGDDFVGKTVVADYAFSDLLRIVNCVDAGNLVLPATTLGKGCYRSMFSDNYMLKRTPVLPATTLSEGCYDYMFFQCYNLKVIKCLATDISATNCTNNWVGGIYGQGIGIFIKNQNMSSWTTGDSGIPYNWTVIEE